MKRAARVCWTTFESAIVILMPFALGWLLGRFNRGCWALLWACGWSAAVQAMPQGLPGTAAGTGAVAEAVHLIRADIASRMGEGFSPPPLRFDAKEIEGDWSSIDLPFAPLPTLMAASARKSDQPATVVHWYRLKLGDPRSAGSAEYIYIPRWKSDGTIAVYANGQLSYQSRANLQWNGSNLPLWIPLDERQSREPLTEVTIRIQHLQGIGGALSSVWVGDGAALRWRYVTRYVLQAFLPFASSATFLALGVFAFFVWLKRRNERLYVLFFAMSVAGYIRTMHIYMGQEYLIVSDEWFGWWTVSAVFWIALVAHLFLVELHRQPSSRLTWTLVLVCLVENLATAPVFGQFLDATIVAPWVYLTALVLIPLTYGINLKKSLRARSKHGIQLSILALATFLLGIYDWLLQNNRVDIENLFIGTYANVAIFYFFSYVIYRRYIESIGEVERVNAGLAQRLKEREEELLESHRLLREVEHKETLRQERQRLMQDMHDGLGSSLVSALRAVERGKQKVDVTQVLKDCVDDLSLTIDSMEPVEADLLLLLGTLRFRLGPRLESAGIALRWEVGDVPDLPWLTPRHSLHILRILQEAITNIIKHAEATEIRLFTATEDDGVVVGIVDNGRGFDLATALAKGGKGLENQRRRAKNINGSVDWAAGPGGTEFRLRLPRQ